MRRAGLRTTEAARRTAKRIEYSGNRTKVVAITVATVLLVAALLFWLGNRTGLFPAQCVVSDLQTAAEAEDKISAGLPDLSEACLERALEEGDGDAMVAAIAGLRVASEEAGSASSALLLAQLFDPNLREELLTSASGSALIPDVSAREAVRYYDLAALNGDETAGASASVLREAFRIPGAGTKLGGGALPIQRDDGTGLYRRVLLKPGGVLVKDRPKPDSALSVNKAKQKKGQASSAGAEEANGKPKVALGKIAGALDIQYVFAEEAGWLWVGRQVNTVEESRQWIKVEDTVEWGHMLGLRYKEPSGQGRVVFFENNRAANNAISRDDLADFHTFLTTKANEGDLANAGVIALEDQSYPWAMTEYVMPITDFEQVERDGQLMTLVKVASVAGWSNPDAGKNPQEKSIGARDERMQTVKLGPSKAKNRCKSKGFADLRHQVVFLVDTTVSMGPYINGVKRIAARWQSEIEERGLTDKFRFGLVGYRNNMDDPPQAGRLEYVRKAYLTPGSNATVSNFAQTVQGMKPAAVSTHDFNEDVAAGLDTALSFDWESECGLRQLYLITDAGALQDTDPKALLSDRSKGLFSLRSKAEDKGIRINVVHLQTPEARAAGNVGSAAETYRQLAGRGRYTFIGDGSPAEFNKYLDSVGTIIAQIERETDDVGVDRNATVSDPNLPSEMILNDLFAVQQTFLGQLAGAQVPVFVDLWTSDRDLADPDDAALDIGVMLDRDQLSQLAEQLDLLIQGVEAEERESGSFFKMLQIISAGTSSDPIAVTMRSADEAALGNQLPSWLVRLPYQSQVLALGEADWRTMSDARKLRLIALLKQQLTNYKSRERDSAKWISFGEGGGRSDVTFIPLEWMP